MINRKNKKKLRKKNYLKRKLEKVMRQRHRYNKKKKCKSKAINVLPKTVQLKRNNKIVELLKKEKFIKKVRRKSKEERVIIDIPQVFSFIKNPDETILTLKKIFYCGNNKKIKKIYFNYDNCKELGLCASLITDLIVVELTKTRKIGLSGTAPQDRLARKMFNITGLPKHLGIRNISTKDTETLETLSNLELSDMCEKLVEYYNNCLHTQGYTLSDDGKNKFGKMFGEVFDNAIKYSGNLGSWHALGYFDRPEEDKNYGKCRLVLMNFGSTIYEGLKAEDTTKYTKKQLERHTKKHHSFFGINFNEEVLWTLYALQKNVSKQRIDKQDTKGKGTIDLIESFMAIGAEINEEKPIMSITSGGCHILFDGTYTLKEIEYKDGRKVPIIAFNDKNSLNHKPDSNYVYALKNKFIGTVISMEFYLDRQYITEMLKKGD